jgi:chemotaxis signal transduction protein
MNITSKEKLLKQLSNIELTSFLVFHIDKYEFCFDMKDLVKIMEPPIGNVSNEGKAFYEYGGIVFNLINLHELFKIKNNGLTVRSKLILLETNEKAICFIADEIVEAIASTEKSSESHIIIPCLGAYLKGIIKYEGREISVPNFEAIVKEYYCW